MWSVTLVTKQINKLTILLLCSAASSILRKESWFTFNKTWMASIRDTFMYFVDVNELLLQLIYIDWRSVKQIIITTLSCNYRDHFVDASHYWIYTEILEWERTIISNILLNYMTGIMSNAICFWIICSHRAQEQTIQKRWPYIMLMEEKNFRLHRLATDSVIYASCKPGKFCKIILNIFKQCFIIDSC